MKTLHYRRHSLKEGNYIGVKGLELALLEGQRAVNALFDQAFHGPLVRTAQTLLAFIMGTVDTPVINPIVEEIGTDAVFASMVNDAFKAGQKQGLSNLACLRAAHDQAKFYDYAVTAGLGLRKMLDAMGDGEDGIAFGHSPIIELAATCVGQAEDDLPAGWDDLKEMDGLVFTQDTDDGSITVTNVIRAVRG